MARDVAENEELYQAFADGDTSKTTHEYECPEHGGVTPKDRQHGGRAHAFVCPRDGCGHTVTNITVDWDAYYEAKENGEKPPCPDCGLEDINEVPITGDKYRCQNCNHSYGDAGAYR